jgi:putative phage-type endonuclease
MAKMVSAAARQIAPYNLQWTDRDAWLALRREGVCGSDIPVICGAPAFGRTRWQLYLDKTGALPDEPMTPRQAESIRFGHRMEAVAASEWAERFPGARLVRVGMLQNVAEPWMRVNIDRRLTFCPDGDGPCGWECKNRGAYTSREWDTGGDPDKIPDGPVLQSHWGMIVTGYRHWHIAVVIGGNELRAYRLEADGELHTTMREEAAWFWHRCVRAGVAPPVDETERTGQILARLWEVDPGKVQTADDAVIARRIALDAAAEAAGKYTAEADRLKHELQEWLGEAEVGLHPATGKPLISWKQNGTFREGAFREEQPEAWAKYARPVLVTDTKALADADEKLFRAYRSRAFRTHALPKEED